MLRLHEKTHSTVKNHQCNICGKYFTTIEYLKVHEKLHKTEYQFRCKICPQEFKTIYYLKKHKKTHSGGEEIKCENYKSNSGLSHHIKTIHSEASN